MHQMACFKQGFHVLKKRLSKIIYDQDFEGYCPKNVLREDLFLFMNELYFLSIFYSR